MRAQRGHPVAAWLGALAVMLLLSYALAGCAPMAPIAGGLALAAATGSSISQGITIAQNIAKLGCATQTAANAIGKQAQAAGDAKVAADASGASRAAGFLCVW